ncbi:MAG TPA: indole-3-glycerol phosphate synthase TrpC [Vicinamibacterales bacterium]|jgi:indole-3-glycerol phosphate synthase|nr:indole-3-glycerol phosphate synthase TrpC [Vicinamibacterales bacterium]
MADAHRGADLLETIVAAARRIVSTREAAVPLRELERRCADRSRTTLSLRRALTSGTAPRIIAECKRRSPSRGVLRREYDPAAIAATYERAGAAAISVLTEPTFFDGSVEHLAAVRKAVTLPVLRKDFIVTEYQILEAAAAGADAVLLIVGALAQDDLVRLVAAARASGLDPLVEVHDETELGRAMSAGADLIGVNSRNLRTLEVTLDVTHRLAAKIPRGIVRVAESGLRTREDIAALMADGYEAFLVGERLMTAPDPGAALSAFVAPIENNAGVEEQR